MSNDFGIYDYALSKVSIINSNKGMLLFLFSLYEIDTDEVRFFLSDTEGQNNDEKAIFLHPQSDQLICIPLKDELYEKLVGLDSILIYEIDWVTGAPLNQYTAHK